MIPGYYAIIPSKVRYDKVLPPNAKLLYGEITALTQKEGYCWASNDYFAELYDVSVETISRWISALKKAGYIEVELLKRQGNKRRIAIDKIVKTYCENNQDLLTKSSIAIDKKVKSYIRINNTINNTSKRALEFLENESPGLYENFLLKYKSQIKDFDKFSEVFNCKVEEEDLEFTSKKISARLTRFAINYISNENKDFSKNKNQSDQVQASIQQYQKNTF